MTKKPDPTRIERVDTAIAAQLARSMKRNSLLSNRNNLLRKTVENINAAANNGRVCDGVAKYDHETTLQEYCESALTLDDTLRSTQDDVEQKREGV